MSNIVGDISTLCLHGIFAIKKTCCFGLCLIFDILQKSQSELGMAALDCRCQHRERPLKSVDEIGRAMLRLLLQQCFVLVLQLQELFFHLLEAQTNGLSIMGVPWGTRKMYHAQTIF